MKELPVFTTNGLTFDVYFDPTSMVPYCIRMIGADGEPFRHGIALKEQFATKLEAYERIKLICEYFGWEIAAKEFS